MQAVGQVPSRPISLKRRWAAVRPVLRSRFKTSTPRIFDLFVCKRAPGPYAADFRSTADRLSTADTYRPPGREAASRARTLAALGVPPPRSWAGGPSRFSFPAPWFASYLFHTDFTQSVSNSSRRPFVNIHHFILDGAVWKAALTTACCGGAACRFSTGRFGRGTELTRRAPCAGAACRGADRARRLGRAGPRRGSFMGKQRPQPPRGSHAGPKHAQSVRQLGSGGGHQRAPAHRGRSATTRRNRRK